MTSQATHAPVRSSITVAVPRERAYSVFVENTGNWWSTEHHIGAVRPESIVLEQRPGGRWYERAPDGTECDWGRVLALEPPERVLLAWHLGPTFAYDPDPAMATEVEVRFVAEGPATTRVELEHRGFEVHGDAGAAMRDAVGAPDGWGLFMRELAAALEG